MHVGFIPDGNRRYAEEKGIDNEESYKESKNTVKQVTKSLEKYAEDLDEVTLYILSEDNLKRSEEQLETLFQLLRHNLDEMREFFRENSYEVNWASTNPEALPEDIRGKLKALEEDFDEGKVKANLLISYSGKKDIVSASESVCGNGSDFSERSVQENLEVSSDIDFVIRTGDNPRRECLSGFPIWNSSYAEYYHIEKNFPEVRPGDVEEAFDHFEKLRRKEGE
jgi:undecaprenyl diphosphate synthase